MKSKDRPSREELDVLYNERMLSMGTIAKQYSVVASTVNKWMESYGITRRTISQARLPKGITKPSKAELKEIYHEQGLSQRDIAERYGIDCSTVLNWLKDYEIIRRTPSERNLPAGCTKPTREEILTLYEEQMLSTIKIAKKYGVAHVTVNKWMESYGITLRTRSEAHLLPKGIIKPSKAELTQRCTNNASMTQIAKEYGVGVHAIIDWMDEYKLTRKKQKITKGSWANLQFTLNAAQQFLDENPQYTTLPSPKALIRTGNSSIVNAITKYHGGFSTFRERLAAHMNQPSQRERGESLLEEWVNE